MRKYIFAIVAALLALPALADEAQIRQAVEAKLGGVKVDGVQATPIPGIFEVRIQGREGPQIVYSDAPIRFSPAGRGPGRRPFQRQRETSGRRYCAS